MFLSYCYLEGGFILPKSSLVILECCLDPEVTASIEAIRRVTLRRQLSSLVYRYFISQTHVL